MGPVNANTPSQLPFPAPPHRPLRLQPVRSFKVRGAYNKMSRLTPEQLARGVICSSAGNHAQVGSFLGRCGGWGPRAWGVAGRRATGSLAASAALCWCAQPACGPSLRLVTSPLPAMLCRAGAVQGVAMAAAALGCTAVICMPTNSPEIKINAVRELGGTVQLVGESFYEAQAIAQVTPAGGSSGEPPGCCVGGMLGGMLRGLLCLLPGAAVSAAAPGACWACRRYCCGGTSLRSAASGLGQAPDPALPDPDPDPARPPARLPACLQERAAKENLVFVSAYDDPLVSKVIPPRCPCCLVEIQPAWGVPATPPRATT